MKETYSISINLPFGDIAEFDYEMTEEEYDEFLEYNGEYSIWEEEQFEPLLSAACVAAAKYIVNYYCDTEDPIIDEQSCTPAKLLEHLDIDEDDAEEILNSDSSTKIDEICDLLWNYEEFTVEV